MQASDGLWRIAAAGQDPDQAGRVLRGISRLNQRVANPAYALLLLTGIVLVVDGDWSWADPWLVTSLVLFALLAGVAVLGHTIALRRQLDGSDDHRVARRTAVTGGLTAGLLIVITVIMITKPG